MKKFIMGLVSTRCHYGAKLPKLSTLDTKSAAHARAILHNMKVETGDARRLKGNLDSDRETTQSVYFEVSAKTAIAFFNKFDQTRNTRDFIEKSENYRKKKAELQQEFPPQDLDGEGKMAYFNRMKPYTFTYYKAKVSLYIVDDDGAMRRETQSITHSRITEYTADQFLSQLTGISNKIDGEMKPTEVNMDNIKEKSSDAWEKRDKNNSDPNTEGTSTPKVPVTPKED